MTQEVSLMPKRHGHVEQVDRKDLTLFDCLSKSGRMAQEQTETVPELYMRQLVSTQQ